MNKLLDHNEIKPQTSWVLIKPDEELEKYHLNGKETSIYVGRSFQKYVDPEDSLDFDEVESVDTRAQHWPITGTVICAPKRNIFYGHEIKKEKNGIGDFVNPEIIEKIKRMGDASVDFQSPVEVKDGDRVLFDYAVPMRCYEDGLYFHTDIGTLLLVRYDKLEGVFIDDTIKPLNSNIFFEWSLPEKTGSFFNVDKELHETDDIQEGIVTHVGSVIRFSKRGSNLEDCSHQFNVGDKIMFNWFDTTMIESDLHLVIFGGEKRYLIKARDIIAIKE